MRGPSERPKWEAKVRGPSGRPRWEAMRGQSGRPWESKVGGRSESRSGRPWESEVGGHVRGPSERT